MASLVLLAFALLLDAVPLWLFTGLISEHARAARVRSVWFLCAAAVSWLLGLLAAYIGLAMLFVRAAGVYEVSDRVIFFSLLVGGLIGAGMGPGVTYLYLRMRTTGDPDYGERLDRRPSP